MSRFSVALAFCAATAATFPVVVADEPDVQRAADLASPVPITVAGTPIDVPPATGRSEASAETTSRPASTPSASPISTLTAGSTCYWVTTSSSVLI